MTILIALFGGMALLLYGIRLSGEALQRVLGARLRSLLTVLSRRRMLAVLCGATVTAILQSSAATTLMLIGFVSAGLMTFRQTLGVILGADIGTSVTVQLIAFNIADYSLLLVGLGFLFLGLKVIVDGVAPLQENPLAVQVLAAISQNVIVAVIVAAVTSA